MQALLLALLLPLSIQELGEPQSRVAESLYAPWSNGPSTDPNWFPIGVWLQDPKLAERYGELGINTFVGLWKGPTREQLSLLKQAKMSVVCSMNRVAMELRDESTIIAWMQEDEPDNRKVEPEKLSNRYAKMSGRDSTRPVWLNLGQGVANDRWKGRLSPREWYPAYASSADILSFDVYPVTNIRRENGGDFLWIIAKGLARLNEWAGGQKPLWNMIECTRVHQAVLKPTPDQVESEVWISLINGSRGIIYFCHNFNPRTEAAALLADAEMRRRVRKINERVLRYAPQLNAPDVRGLVSVTTNDSKSPVAVMAKQVDGWTYLFSVGMRKRAVKASFQLKDESFSGELEVLDEKRVLSVKAGSFHDEFQPFATHIYRYRS